eukprot:6331637-Heterocapsa_arctica.AAC.1
MGVAAGVRGQPWAQLSKGSRPPYKMLSFGTLTRAIYEAHRRNPTNPNVQAIVSSAESMQREKGFAWFIPRTRCKPFAIGSQG